MQDNVADRNIGAYMDALAGNQAAPGGGSAAGIVGALAACLAEMMASLTTEPSERLLASKVTLADLRQQALKSARNDELSYGGYIEALQLPKSTSEEKDARKLAMASAIENAARVPLALAAISVEIVTSLESVILDGNKTVLGDADAAIVLAQATLDICDINVRANLGYIKNEALANELRTSIEAAREMLVRLTAERRSQIEGRSA